MIVGGYGASFLFLAPTSFLAGTCGYSFCLVLLNFLFYDLSNISYLKLKLIKKKKKNSSSSILKPYKIRIFFLLFRTMVRRLSQVKLEKWASVAWAIWNARNKFYFEHIQLHPRTILDGAFGFLAEYQHFVAAQSNM